MKRKEARPGVRFRVIEGSGLASNKTGVILGTRPPSNDRGIVTYPGHYHPFRPAIEAHVRYDNGECDTMFYERLIMVTP